MSFRIADKDTTTSQSIAPSFLLTQNRTGEWRVLGEREQRSFRVRVRVGTHVCALSVSTYQTGGLWRKAGGTRNRDSKYLL